MDPVDEHAVAVALDSARRTGTTLSVEAVRVGDVSTAYAVQRALTSIRLARGDRRVGWKLGYTTAAMREQMGIDEPNYGPLLASMRVDDDVLPSGLLHPRVEPEIALVLATDPGPGATPDRVLAACSRAHVALEVVDSVWTGYRFDLEHNTADGSSAAGFVLGDEIALGSGGVTVRLEVAGPPEQDGPITTVLEGSSSMRAAAEAVSWLVARLGADGDALAAGDVVLTGGLTRAVPLVPGSRAEARVTGRSPVAAVRVRA